MSKLINISSLRNGVGRTTVACILGHKLAQEGYKTLLIDNNFKFCDLANYLLVDAPYNIDNIIPFIRANTIDKATLKSVLVPVEKNLELLAGSKMTTINNTLGKEHIQKIKEILDADFDFIVIDSRSGIEHKELLDMADIVDDSFIITQANRHDKTHFESLKENLSEEDKVALESLIKKSSVIFNKAVEGQNHSLTLFQEDKIYKLNHSSQLLDFCNGFKCNIFTNNENEINQIVSVLTKKEISIKSKGKRLIFTDKLRAIIGSL